MKKFKKLLIIGVLMAVLIAPNVSFAALTQNQINAITSLLQSFGADQTTINNVQTALTGAPTSPTPAAWCHDFNVNLKSGDTSEEVSALHTALSKEGFGIGNYEQSVKDFSEGTASAVSGFQQKYKDEILTPLGLRFGTGYVGASTRMKLNSLYGCGVVPPPASVTLTGVTPTSGPVGTKIKLTGCGPDSALGYNLIYTGPKNGTDNIDVVSLGGGCGYMLFDVPADFPAGSYKLSVKNNSTGQVSANSLAFTITSSAGSPSITVLSPNGGEVWEAGKMYPIKWTNTTQKNVGIEVMGNRGNDNTAFGVFPPSQTSYNFTVPSSWQTGSDFKVIINTYDGVTADTSDAPFSIVAAGTDSGLMISAPSQPSATLAVAGATVPFTKITLIASSNDVTVNGIIVDRTGLTNDAAFASIFLLDENGGVTSGANIFDSNHRATLVPLNEYKNAFVVKAGQSRTLTVAGLMTSNLAPYAGQVAYLSVMGINASVTPTGSLPITGTGQTINASLTIGSVTMNRGALDPASNVVKNIGTTGYTFSSIKVTAGSVEKVRVKSIIWNQSGSAVASDLANVKTYVGGTAYDAVVSSDGKYYTSTFGDGIVVGIGNSIEISIKGDIAGGSGRTIDFDINKNTDLYITGETYGYGIGAPTTGTPGLFGSTQPWYNASVVAVGETTTPASSETTISCSGSGYTYTAYGKKDTAGNYQTKGVMSGTSSCDTGWVSGTSATCPAQKWIGPVGGIFTPAVNASVSGGALYVKGYGNNGVSICAGDKNFSFNSDLNQMASVLESVKSVLNQILELLKK
ncbi:MAG: hypothetical protein WC587_03460 [Candidatus Paceibacterota bacterium]